MSEAMKMELYFKKEYLQQTGRLVVYFKRINFPLPTKCLVGDEAGEEILVTAAFST